MYIYVNTYFWATLYNVHNEYKYVKHIYILICNARMIENVEFNISYKMLIMYIIIYIITYFILSAKSCKKFYLFIYFSKIL